MDIDGVTYSVTTEIKGQHEEFTNFFTNRRPTVEEQGSSNTVNQHEQPQQSVSADEVTNNSSPLQENGELFRPEDEYTAEEQAIIDQAKVNSTYLKAPNGKDTKLTPKQWAQARTQAFKNWFGDWKLVFKKDFLLNGSPVKSLTGNEFARVANKNLTDQVEEYFESIGNIAHSPLYGDVILDRDGADDSLAHGMGRTKAIAYAAVKEVIEAGVLIDYHNNHKGRGYDSAVVAAPH